MHSVYATGACLHMLHVCAFVHLCVGVPLRLLDVIITFAYLQTVEMGAEVFSQTI